MKANSLSAVFFAELFGTFFFVALGLGSVAVLVLGLSDISYPVMASCWGVAIAMAIYAIGGVSGAHMNPAVTIALAAWGGFDKSRVLPYIIAQVIGAFLAAVLVYFLFRAQITDFEAANGLVRGEASGLGSAGMFATAAGAKVSMFTAAVAEAFMTAILVLVIFATVDPKNPTAPSAGIPALAIGASVIFCGIAFGPLTGFAMNPARDLGPRIFLMLNGWGGSAVGVNSYGLIVPIFATTFGGLAGGWLYTKVICKGLAAHQE